MPPRNPELPEGTDHIINGAMDTSGDTGLQGAGGTSGGFVGSGAGDDTGGMSSGIGTGTSSVGATTGSSGLSATGGGTGGIGGGTTGIGGSGGGDFGGGSGGGFGGGSGGSSGSGGTGDIKAQLREGASGLQQQAGEKIRAYAETGKTRATSALDDFSQVVSDAAGSIDERLGSEYGEYARRAADAVSGLADSLRTREVDQLFEDGRNLVRKSPGIAIGAAAVIGFTLVRLIKSGMDTDFGRRGGEREIEFEPDPSLGSTTSGTTAIGGATGTTSATYSGGTTGGAGTTTTGV